MAPARVPDFTALINWSLASWREGDDPGRILDYVCRQVYAQCCRDHGLAMWDEEQTPTLGPHERTTERPPSSGSTTPGMPAPSMPRGVKP